MGILTNARVTKRKLKVPPLLWSLISQLPSESLRTHILLLITKETLIIVPYYLVREELI